MVIKRKKIKRDEDDNEEKDDSMDMKNEEESTNEPNDGSLPIEEGGEEPNNENTSSSSLTEDKESAAVSYLIDFVAIDFDPIFLKDSASEEKVVCNGNTENEEEESDMTTQDSMDATVSSIKEDTVDESKSNFIFRRIIIIAMWQ